MLFLQLKYCFVQLFPRLVHSEKRVYNIIMNVHALKKACVLLAALLIFATGCAPKMNSALGFHLDTVITVNGYCSEELLKEAVALCGEYEKVLSKTVEGSDVWRINTAGGTPVEVCEHTANILSLASDISERSGGSFDVTVAPAAALWDFKADVPALPDSEALAQAAALVDYSKVSLEENTVLLPADMSVDLGGIAKGYIADRVQDYLLENGVESALLNLGGNTVALGSKPGGENWRIGIQDPQSENGEYIAVVSVTDKAVVTSGSYQRYFDIDGERYHHILDTKTGYPVNNGVASVTIVADKSALADALSTACFALGCEEGMKLAEECGAEAIYIKESGEILYTEGLSGCLEITE